MGQALKVAKTSELYRIPLATKSGYEAKECITWPRYSYGQFSLDHSTGPCMHEMTVDECRALSIVVLRTSVQQERYGAAHQFNWKKVGLSRAYFKKDLVCEASMPTARSKAAFHFLKEHSKYYRSFLTHQRIRSGARVALNPPPPKKKNTNKTTKTKTAAKTTTTTQSTDTPFLRAQNKSYSSFLTPGGSVSRTAAP